MATAWKGLNPDGTSCYGGSGKWSLPKNGKPGKWRTEKGPLELCSPGTLHLSATTYQLLSWLNSPAIFVAEYDEHGPIAWADDKIGVLRARLLSRCEHWNEQTARLFAADCADAVPQGEAGKAAILAACRYALGLIGEDELANVCAAAWEVADSEAAWPDRFAAWASYSAALPAAYSAAYSAALSSARCAAWAAYSAALSVSYSAAYSAARTAQAARLDDYLLGRVDLDAIRDKVA